MANKKKAKKANTAAKAKLTEAAARKALHAAVAALREAQDAKELARQKKLRIGFNKNKNKDKTKDEIVPAQAALQALEYLNDSRDYLFLVMLELAPLTRPLKK